MEFHHVGMPTQFSGRGGRSGFQIYCKIFLPSFVKVSFLYESMQIKTGIAHGLGKRSS